MYKYKLINYFDVWYSDEEGYQVNNLCEEGTITMVDGSNEEVVQSLKDFGFLTPGAHVEQFDIWNDYEMIEILAMETGEPIGRLELIHE